MPYSFTVSVKTAHLPDLECKVGYDGQEIVIWGPCGHIGEFRYDQIPAVIAACYKQCPDIFAIIIRPGRDE